MQRTVSPIFGNGGEGLARGGIVAAIKPQLPTRRQKIDEFTGGEVLGPCRPIDRSQTMGNRRVVNFKSVEISKTCDGQTCIVDLVRPRQRR